jgi:hypothetical protein
MKSLHLSTLDCGDGLDRRDVLKLFALTSAAIATGCVSVDDYPSRGVYYPGAYPAPTPIPKGPPVSRYVDPRIAMWRQRVKTFGYAVLPQTWADYYARKVEESGVEVWSYRTFHGQFSSPYAFAEQLQPCTSRYGNTTFEVAGLPYFDSQSPCRRTKDLNEIEIERLLEPREIAYYGCVLAPCSERRAPTRDDRDLFARTAREYRADPAAYNLDYVRNVSDGRSDHRQLYAHGATGRVNNPDGSPRKNLFLSSFDVS